MTPKEKAKHLVDFYTEQLHKGIGRIYSEVAKDLAYDFANEMVGEYDDHHPEYICEREAYWIEVRTEIEKL